MSGDSDRPERRRRERLMSGEDEPRLERVVVGMDFQPSSLEALRWTRTVFAPRAELVVVHVRDEGEAASPSISASEATSEAVSQVALEVGSGVTSAAVSEFESEVTSEVASAEARLRTLCEAMGPPPARDIVRSGYPPTVVAAVAEESGADLIVVGTRGPGTPASSHLGSTAERLIRISPVPVLLATHGPRPTRILVPVDESELTSPVLAWTAHLAGLWGASVTLLHVVDPAAPPVDDDAAIWLARLADELRRPPRGPTAKVTPVVAAGTPGDAVLAAAAELQAELIIMGRRGAGRIFSGLIGSTASTVLRGADCPVLVVVDPPFAIIDSW